MKKILIILFVSITTATFSQSRHSFLGVDFTKEIDDFGISRVELGRANPVIGIAVKYTNLNTNHALSDLGFDHETVLFSKTGEVAAFYCLKKAYGNSSSEENINAKSFFLKLKTKLREQFAEFNGVKTIQDEYYIYEFHYGDLKYIANISKNNEVHLLVSTIKETAKNDNTDDITSNKKIDERNGFKSLKLNTKYSEFNFNSVDEIVDKSPDVKTVIWKSLPYNLSYIYDTKIRAINLMFSKLDNKLKMIQVFAYKEGSLSDDTVGSEYMSIVKNITTSLGHPDEINDKKASFQWVGNVCSIKAEINQMLKSDGYDFDFCTMVFSFLRLDDNSLLENGF